MTSFENTAQESDLRIILIGPSGVGMASVGNIIIGRTVFGAERSNKCRIRDGEIAGRKVTVVVTPNCWFNLPLIDTTRRDEQELMLSMFHCRPGPHAILLVIGDEAITKNVAESMEEHTELLGRNVWGNAILLYSYANQHKECIKSAGAAFEQISHKCGHRHHVLNNSNCGEQTQVTELVKKIDDMLQENKGKHCEIYRKIYLVQKCRDEDDERAQQRLLKTQKKRKMLRAKMGHTSHFSELRILLTGYQYSGKSSTGNTILAQEAFSLNKITKCVIRQGDVHERHITLVDTPGRWRIHKVQHSTELCKQDIVLSASQCPPGPHVFLLLVRLDTSFNESNRIAMEGHLQLFGENVWRHAMVLFTCGDFLIETTIEEFIESEGDALQWLVQKCNNMYHVFNNRKDDHSQVSELLEKIDEVIASNGGTHFQMDERVLQEVQTKRKRAEDQARMRRLRAQEQQKGKEQATHSESEKGASPNEPEINIVLSGCKRAGKTTVGNLILGKKEFPERMTVQSVHKQAHIDGRRVIVVDTPGWDWDNVFKETPQLDSEILQSIQRHCSKVAPIVILLVVRATSSFKDMNKRITEEYLQLFGDCVWNHTIVLFTTGGWMEDVDIELHIESEGEALQWLVEKCGNRYQVFDTKGRKVDLQVPELMRKIEQVVENNKDCLCQFDKEMYERKFTTVCKQTSQMMLKDSWKHDSLILLPPFMGGDADGGDDDDDDDGGKKSLGYCSLQSLLLSAPSSESLSHGPETGRAQGIHYSQSRSLRSLLSATDSRTDPETASVTSDREKKKKKSLYRFL